MICLQQSTSATATRALVAVRAWTGWTDTHVFVAKDERAPTANEVTTRHIQRALRSCQQNVIPKSRLWGSRYLYSQTSNDRFLLCIQWFNDEKLAVCQFSRRTACTLSESSIYGCKNNTLDVQRTDFGNTRLAFFQSPPFVFCRN